MCASVHVCVCVKYKIQYDFQNTKICYVHVGTKKIQWVILLALNAGLEEVQAGIKIAGRNVNNLRYADDTTLMAESEEELKSLLMKVKVESEKLA